MSPGIPGPFVAIVVIMVAVGIATTLWRVSAARSMAQRAGLDPDEAAAMTLLTRNGLDATYVAANLKGGAATPAATAAPTRSAEDRLRELEDLHQRGVVTSAEYDARRRAIIDSI